MLQPTLHSMFFFLIGSLSDMEPDLLESWGVGIAFMGWWIDRAIVIVRVSMAIIRKPTWFVVGVGCPYSGGDFFIYHPNYTASVVFRWWWSCIKIVTGSSGSVVAVYTCVHLSEWSLDEHECFCVVCGVRKCTCLGSVSYGRRRPGCMVCRTCHLDRGEWCHLCRGPWRWFFLLLDGSGLP